MLKRPDVLIVNEATASLDAAVQGKIMEALFAEFKGRGLIWVLHRASLARNFDQVLVLKGGRIAQSGKFEEIDGSGTELRALIDSE